MNHQRTQAIEMHPRRSLKIRILCSLAYWIFQLLTCTYRVRYHGTDRLERAKTLHPSGSFVYGLWHEFFFTAVATHRYQNVAPMISQSNDGELISSIAERLGFSPVRGSTSRGGEAARAELYARIDKGLHAAFTADGPRGPRRKAKSGLVDLSRSGQMPILPLGIAADRAWILHKSWDHSMIPKPFARVHVYYGEPYTVAADTHGMAFGAAKKRATESLNSAAAAALAEARSS